MEGWLTDNQHAEINMAESGVPDMTVGELLAICGIGARELGEISLENPDPWGSAGLRETIAGQYSGAKRENVLVTTGTSEALFAFFNAVLDWGDEVITQSPAFQPLYQIPAAIGCRVVPINMLGKAGKGTLAEKVRGAAGRKTKLIIINTPHNPTGKVLANKEMREIIEIAESLGAYVLFDEQYRFLPLEGTESLPSGFDANPSGYSGVFATGSMLKCFGLMGLRVGWLVGKGNEMQLCRNYKDYLTHVTPPLSDFLGNAALENKGKILSRLKNEIGGNIGMLDEFMERNSGHFEYSRPEGGVVCFPKIGFSKESRGFCERLLMKHGVSVLPGKEGFGAEGYFRMNFGIQNERFGEALRRMEKCAKELSARA
ncbi:aminotransferase class I/II-fold pyridoxal phosphate-dependent enzyme [Candidatus Micrarchaeota archaeon]|nr:aminotransferase class I/II-fold pyridoxal phosphate-dependent enzyme [Candidatus Micrarchaeota archaeon]